MIGVLGLLVFGPERLPKAAADAGRLLRQARQAAAAARQELADAAGLDDDELNRTLSDLKDLDPRRAVRSMFSDEPAPSPDSTPPRSAIQQPGRRSAPAGSPAQAGSAQPGPAPTTSASADLEAGTPGAAGADQTKAGPTDPASASRVDPDWM